jgi:hypothetical protein
MAALVALEAEILRIVGEEPRQRVSIPTAVSTFAQQQKATASGVTTLSGIAKAPQARGIRTPAGRSEWQPVRVSRMLARVS